VVAETWPKRNVPCLSVGSQTKTTEFVFSAGALGNAGPLEVLALWHSSRMTNSTDALSSHASLNE
jgi:hypothetical protein